MGAKHVEVKDGKKWNKLIEKAEKRKMESNEDKRCSEEGKEKEEREGGERNKGRR